MRNEKRATFEEFADDLMSRLVLICGIFIHGRCDKGSKEDTVSTVELHMYLP